LKISRNFFIVINAFFFFKVDPLRYPPLVELVNIKDWHLRDPPPRLVIKWDRHELSYAESDPVNIELWGYYEDNNGPHWDLLQVTKFVDGFVFAYLVI
jgi:hypothetical protein